MPKSVGRERGVSKATIYRRWPSKGPALGRRSNRSGGATGCLHGRRPERSDIGLFVATSVFHASMRCPTSRRRSASVRSIDGAICGRFSKRDRKSSASTSKTCSGSAARTPWPSAGRRRRAHLAQDGPSSEPMESASDVNLRLTVEDHVHRVGLVAGVEDRLARREKTLWSASSSASMSSRPTPSSKWITPALPLSILFTLLIAANPLWTGRRPAPARVGRRLAAHVRRHAVLPAGPRWPGRPPRALHVCR
jgi:hypothetical protein